ncbi:hypothetical protein K435DRAFT_376119 [Dendrothele bispora CBS 962.96]|uniref:Late embryogenesis abundant protein LEA-2 subgroup domain-containing protein n=1 Tax=Dendrothele bispora (strain CBS 962.96) TaxID=1314807 RepID=A0A4S8MGS4_DENBC|nr:hypothetical protein K435DRAFT_376119 [Dendrothele bispora CBS 962.96]
MSRTSKFLGQSETRLTSSYPFAFSPENGSQPYPQRSSFDDPDPFAKRGTLQEPTAPLNIIGTDSPYAGKETIEEERSYAPSSLNEVITADNAKQYRQQSHGNLWTKGPAGRRTLRYISCSILITLYLFVGIVISLVLFLRPPNASISKPDINVDEAALIRNPSNVVTGFTIPLQINISVWNPNIVSATAKRVSVGVFYTVNDQEFMIGNGTIADKVIKSNARTNVSFPIDITYSADLDPRKEVLGDILQRCLFNNEGLSFSAKLDRVF